MGLFKRAAVRGIAHELARTGVCSFPSKLAMDGAADAIADAAPGMPEMSPPEGHDPEQVAAVANKLIEIAHELMQSAGAGGAPPGAPPPDIGAAEVKTSASQDYETLAYNAAVECMDKSAAEVKSAGALIHGGDKQNTSTAAEGEVAELDKRQRPDGKYHDGRAVTQLNTAPGEIGDLSAAPVKPTNTPSGTNSLHKSAYEAIIRKHANALIHGGDKGNTETQAAATNGVAALDLKQRPVGKYHVGQGNANIGEVAAARVGVETAASAPPSRSPGGSNSVTAASKKTAGLNEEQAMYLALFEKTAADVGGFLPKSLSDDQKVAALQRMVPMDHDARQAELDGLYKAASGLPEALKAMQFGAKGNDGDKDNDGTKDNSPEEKKGDKGSEKKDDEDKKDGEGKKESSLLARIRSITSEASAGR